MFSSLVDKIKRIWDNLKRSQIKPLKTHHHDVTLLYRARGRSVPRPKQIMQVGKFLGKREKKMVLFSFFIFLIGLIWLGVGFIDSHRDQVPVSGGRYIEAVVGSPQFVNPVFASTNDIDTDITRLIFSGLMRYDERHRLIPDLAVKYEASEDKKIYTFELRQDVFWHDGEPFTARDIVFTFDTIQNSLVGSPLQVSFQGIEVSVLDDYTVRFILPEAFSPFLSSLIVGIIPEHLWFEVQPEQMRLNALNLQPIGTGPFKFKKLTKNEAEYIYNYEMELFDRYYRQVPFLKEFVFQFFSDYEGQGGAIDAFREKKITALNFVPNALRDKIERKYTQLHVMELPQYTALFFNQEQLPILKDKNLRQALSYAVDKQRILNEVLKNEGYIINSPILPGFPGYDPELGSNIHSFEDANELLDKDWTRVNAEEYREVRKGKLIKEWEDQQALLLEQTASSTDVGVVEQNESSQPEETEVSTTTARELTEKEIDKLLDEELQAAQLFYREDDDKNILEITITTVQNEEYRKTAELIAGLWQNIGVKTNLEFIEPRDFTRKVLRDRDYDILLYGEIVGNDPDPFPYWHSSQIDYPGLNLGRYVNRNVDTLIEEARESTDENEVAETYKKFQEIIIAEVPAIFLYMPTYIYATTNEVEGLDVVRISHPSDRFADVTTWYMKTKGDWNF
ncbi:MAG: ABC transporter substrate-binding protein [Candidatus Magasanikbacteria bacterium]